MGRLEVLGAAEIGDGAADVQHPVKGPDAQTQAVSLKLGKIISIRGKRGVD
jgi:hypothetical protein